MKFLHLLFVFLLSASVASACSFGPDADRVQSAESNIEKYSNIFVATVLEKRDLDKFAGTEYVFKVSKTYKGALDEGEITIISPGHSCGSFFSEGQIGLFFLNDVQTIDETNPQYFYDSLDKALAAGDSLFSQMQTFENQGELDTPDNIPENQIACTKEYAPVCGSLQVQCIQAPCPPVVSTYPNECVMNSSGATRVSQGVCEADAFEVVEGPVATLAQEGILIGPETGPLVGFVEPLGPPPTAYADRKEVKITPWWRELLTTIRALFAWF